MIGPVTRLLAIEAEKGAYTFSKLFKS